MGKRKRRAFTKEFKAETVRLVRDSERSVGAVPRELGLTETALRAGSDRPRLTPGAGPRVRSRPRNGRNSGGCGGRGSRDRS